jgi:hypothetical protein
MSLYGDNMIDVIAPIIAPEKQEAAAAGKEAVRQDG